MGVVCGDKIDLPCIDMTSNKLFNLAYYQGNYVVLYFYPKDNTTGCTSESIEFSQKYKKFSDFGAEVFGVSKDSLTSHRKFKEKYDMPFELIADVDKKLCGIFGVLKGKSMFGKKYIGIERSTFVVNSEGILIREFRKVKVKGHVDAVLDFISQHSHIGS